MFVSSVTQPGLETIAKSGRGPKVFQLYVRGDDDWIGDHVARAADAGYDAFCLTVDTAHLSRRERDIAKRFRKPWQARNSGMEFQAGLNWKNVEAFKARHKIPLIVKGIATAEDAALCVEHGVDVVYVSNHGGRQLDQGQSTIKSTAALAKQFKGRTKIMMDGGIRSGSDIAVAIASGAEFTFLGRASMYGVCAMGAKGGDQVVEILQKQLQQVMEQLGCEVLEDLPRHLV